MWKQLIRKHCSDEDLLAYADGELSPVRSVTVKNHLALCWQCRNRLKEIEAQTQLIVKAIRDDSLPGADRVAQARLKFLTWQQQFERSLAPVPQLQAPSFRPFRAALLACACALIFASAFMVWLRSTNRITTDADILSRTEKADEVLLHTPALVHQSFQIRTAQIQPSEVERTGRIDVWSYSDGLRSVSRWSDSRGVLREAVWRSGKDAVYVYNPNVGPGIVALNRPPVTRVRSLLDLSTFTANVGEFEAGVMDWLETRDWRPIALSSDIRTFTNDEGATLRAERVGGKLCLEAERLSGGVRVHISLQLDSGSYAPRLQTIRFEAGGRVMEVELAGQECTLVNAPQVLPAVFDPHLTSIPSPTVSISANPTALRPPREPVAAPILRERPVHLQRASLVPLEMEVRYALHRVKACLGEAAEIDEVTDDNTNYLEVKGVVETRARKEELVAALAEFPSVRLNLVTAEEVLAAGPSLPLPPTASEPLSQTHILLANRSLPIQPVLEALFANDGTSNPAPVGQRIADLATEAVSMSQSALSDAWALRHLEARYGESWSDLPPESRWLLKLMIADHVRELEQESERIQKLLNPVLSKISAPGSDPIITSSDVISQANPDWASMTHSMFESVLRIDDLVRALFAGSDPPQTTRPESSPGLAAQSDAEQLRRTTQDLTASFALLKSKFHGFEVASQNALR